MHIGTNFHNRQNLFDYFWDLKNIVPGREERKHNERQIKAEIFCIEKYLVTLAHYNLLAYPLELVQQTRVQAPDFVINKIKGVEVTEATDEEYQKWLTSISGQDGPHMYNEHGYIGNYPEEMAVNKVMACIERKLLKIRGYKSNNPEIRSCDLLIYENTECPLQKEEVFKRLIKQSIDPERVFGNISVICGDALFYSINTLLAQHLAIPMLVDS